MAGGGNVYKQKHLQVKRATSKESMFPCNIFDKSMSKLWQIQQFKQNSRQALTEWQGKAIIELGSDKIDFLSGLSPIIALSLLMLNFAQIIWFVKVVRFFFTFLHGFVEIDIWSFYMDPSSCTPQICPFVYTIVIWGGEILHLKVTKQCLKFYTVCKEPLWVPIWKFYTWLKKNLHNQRLWWFWQIYEVCKIAIWIS